jgi:PTH1 family peptidyl-tRNA hydrolase
MQLWVGLGNPGPSHARQRHNIGFMAIEAIARRHGFGNWRRRFHGLMAEGALAGARILALKPLTYMNASGESVQQAAAFYRIPPEQIVVFHDELDLAPGKVRIKRGGSAAGHNGLRSIDRALGTPDYWRVRLGIGHPREKDRVLGHVLGDFTAEDQEWLGPVLEALADAAPLIASREHEKAMSRIALAAKAPARTEEKQQPESA